MADAEAMVEVEDLITDSAHPSPPSQPSKGVRKGRSSVPSVGRELAGLLFAQSQSAHRSLPFDAGASQKRLRSTAQQPPTTSPRALIDAQPTSPAPMPRTRRSLRSAAITPPAVEKRQEEAIEADEPPLDVQVKAPAPPPRTQRGAVLKAEVVRTASERKARKAARPSAPAGPQVDEEERKALQLYLLDHPHDPLSLKQAAAVYRLHFPPCAPLTSSSSTPLVKCKGDHPNCLHLLGYKRKGIWASTPPHLALLGSNPHDSMRAQDYVGLRNYGATCLAVGTLIALADGTSVPIEKVQAGAEVLSYSAALGPGETEGLMVRRVNAVLNRGHRECVELLFSDKRTLVCTPDHRIRTADCRWVAAGDLEVGTDEVAVGAEYPNATAAAEGDNEDNDVNRSLDEVTCGVHRAAEVLPLSQVQLVGRRAAGVHHVYDLSVPSPQGEDSRSFVANGVVVHNCFGQSPHTRRTTHSRHNHLPSSHSIPLSPLPLPCVVLCQ